MRKPAAPLSPFLALLALVSLSASAIAQESNPTYAALRAARPQGRSLAVQNLVLERDAFRLQFASGTFQFLTPVENRTVGAVFVGDGGLELKAGPDAERRQLTLMTGEKDVSTMSDRFDSAVLLFSDSTAAEIERKATPADASPRAGEVYDTFFRTQKKDLKENLQIRLLRDLLESPDQKGSAFLAYIVLKKNPPAFASVNYFPGTEEVTLVVPGERDGGTWYSARRKAEGEAGQTNAAHLRAHAEHYAIDTTIQRNADIQGTTTVAFQPNVSPLRVLPIHLFGKLRIQEASFSDSDQGPWQPLAVIQEKEDEDSDAAVVFPSSLATGKTMFLRVRYGGKDVLRDVGDGNFAVRVRQSWYPNLGSFEEGVATFDLTYRVPKGNEVVSVGKRVEDKTEGATHVSVWKAERPIRVAGFNYGKFKKLERDDKDSGVHVEVYTNPGTPDIVHQINGYLQGRSSPTTNVNPNDLENLNVYSTACVGLSGLHVDTDSLADSAMADGVNTARVCSSYFGPLTDGHVAITQQTQWGFGQSWPSLIFLPYLAALDGTTRRELGLKDTNDFVENVGPHEFAHQWWGHLVGFRTYRDQWLSEGLAEFSAALVLQATGGVKKFNDYWEKQRKWILAKPIGASLSNIEAGPITQGFRLSTTKNPWAYQAMVYSKGAYVMHMLRMLMRDPASQKPDEKFIAMMHDFVTSYAGKNPSTRDFQTIVERHMTPAMNAAGDGKMDWFFKQWVYGTEIPRYTQKLEISKQGAGEYRLSGNVSQEGVSNDFRGQAYVYVELPKGVDVRLGVLSIVGNKTEPIGGTLRLPKEPKRLVLNASHDTLWRD
ncbi:MAG TPA: M1 family aminopeptidase [Thermoanaerobaculia bacterium]|nr:M1 family aminopeptidase [Thermoanaerobaculia bacterium]